jgi:hypothetical protein
LRVCTEIPRVNVLSLQEAHDQSHHWHWQYKFINVYPVM